MSSSSSTRPFANCCLAKHSKQSCLCKTPELRAIESTAFETRSKAAMPKRRPVADAKPKATPKKASSSAGPAAKPKAEAPAGRKTGKQAA